MGTPLFSRCRGLSLVFAGLMLFFAGTAGAEIYKWVDENGVAHFQDTPPPDSRFPYSTYEPPPHAIVPKGTYEPPVVVPEKKTPEPPPLPEVVLYTTSWCGYCAKARAFFRSRGIPFKDYDIEKDTKAARRREQIHKSRGVPLAVINGVKIMGFSESSYTRALLR